MDVRAYWQRAKGLDRLIIITVIINLVYWLISSLTFSLEIRLASLFAFYPELLDSLLKPWTYLSYVFIHKDIWHLFINMLVLRFIGQRFIQEYGFRSFFALFLIGGIVGAISYQVIYSLGFGLTDISFLPLPLLGASASIFCIIFALIFREPYEQLRLNKEYAIPYTYIAYGLLILEVISILFLEDKNIGGELAHIGGAVFGMIYASLIRQKGIDLSEPIAKAIDWLILQWATINHRFHKRDKQHRKINTQKLRDIERKMRHSGYRSLDENEQKILIKRKK